MYTCKDIIIPHIARIVGGVFEQQINIGIYISYYEIKALRSMFTYRILCSTYYTVEQNS